MPLDIVIKSAAKKILSCEKCTVIEVYFGVESWSSQVCSWEDQETETAKKLSRCIRTILCE